MYFCLLPYKKQEKFDLGIFKCRIARFFEAPPCGCPVPVSCLRVSGMRREVYEQVILGGKNA